MIASSSPFQSQAHMKTVGPNVQFLPAHLPGKRHVSQIQTAFLRDRSYPLQHRL